MKIVSLYAYLQNNVGDDLMVDILLRRYPKVIFFYNAKWNIHGGDSFCDYDNFYNLNRFYEKWKHLNRMVNILTFNVKKDVFYRVLLRLIKKITVCSVYIGGSIYMQRTVKSVEREREKLSSGPLFVIGANFGPFWDEAFYKEFYEYFKECSDVCFRDKKSYQLFSALSNTRYAPDVVFNAPDIKINGGESVLISVIDFSYRERLQVYEGQYLKLIAEICEKVDKEEKQTVLCSFCEREGDEKAIEKLIMLLKPQLQAKVKIFRYHKLPDLYEILKDACFIVATRFHAMILAIKYQIPFFCIAYDSKITNVMEDMRCDAYCLPAEISSINVDDVFNFRYDFNTIEKSIEKADEQFKALDSYLLGQSDNKSINYRSM